MGFLSQWPRKVKTEFQTEQRPCKIPCMSVGFEEVNILNSIFLMLKEKAFASIQG